MEALTWIWYGSVGVAAVALLVAWARPGRRRGALLVAAGGFLVAGVLGILTIGVLFLALSVVCAVAAGRVGRLDAWHTS